MITKTFVVYGPVVAKQRPRFSRTGGYVRSYTPQKTVNYENLVKMCYYQEHGGSDMLKGALSLYVDIYFSIPKSYTKKQVLEIKERLFYHTKKPDCSNVVKSIEDALNGVAYLDDSQIVSLKAIKRYTFDEPRVEIELKEIV